MSRVGDGARRILGPVRRHPRIAWAVAAVIALPVLLIVAANAYVMLSSGARRPATFGRSRMPRSRSSSGALSTRMGR